MKESSKAAVARSSKPLRVLKLIKGMVSSTTALSNVSSKSPSLSETPFRILVSTILSSRTRDAVTEAASARLFAKYPDSRSLSSAKRRDILRLIKPVSFYRVKSARLIEVSRIIEEKYNGRVPMKMDQLLELPGVGRKTANCVLVYGFNSPAIPVDVHVHRVSNRIGLVSTKLPEDTEMQLSDLYPKKYWLDINELFVAFGQTICKPIIPRCNICAVRPLCDYYVRKETTLVS
ncbi:MAG: endonuclease III domain-containing protein [Nitrososphaerales archaeon]